MRITSPSLTIDFRGCKFFPWHGPEIQYPSFMRNKAPCEEHKIYFLLKFKKLPGEKSRGAPMCGHELE